MISQVLIHSHRSSYLSNIAGVWPLILVIGVDVVVAIPAVSVVRAIGTALGPLVQARFQW
jgi:hypothetical protein